MVWDLVKAGIRDLQTFSNNCSNNPKVLTGFRDRITKGIVLQLLTHIDFIKAPSFRSESEYRLISDPNDGTLKTPHIQYNKRDQEEIPFIFMDFRDPKTGRLPLSEIKVGPNASFSEEKVFLEKLLNELGYGSDHRDRPLISQSSLKSRNGGGQEIG